MTTATATDKTRRAKTNENKVKKENIALQYQQKLIVFLVRGTSPLLQNNAMSMFDNPEDLTKTGSLSSSKTYEPEDEAAKRCYRDGDMYCHPSASFKKSMISAVTGLKLMKGRSGKPQAATKLLKQSIQIAEPYSVLEDSDGNPLRKYQIHKSVVDVRGNKVLRCRPIWHDWYVKVAFQAYTEMVQESQLQECMTAAGCTTGVGDWRAETGGTFGSFHAEIIQ